MKNNLRAVDQSPPPPPPPDAARLREIRVLMQRWSTKRTVLPGGGPSPSTYVADAGLELLAEIDRLAAELAATRATWQEDWACAHAERCVSRSDDGAKCTGELGWCGWPPDPLLAVLEGVDG